MHRKLITAAALAGALAAPAAAAAHITATPDTAPAEGYSAFTLRVGHGCEDSPTTRLIVRMPDQVLSATPEAVPGWAVTTKEGKLAQSYDSHGETITEGVRQVTWTGGPLDPHEYLEFGLSVRFGGKPGDVAEFKTIQICEQGRTAWIQPTVAGQEEPESPAPIVTLTAAEEPHGEDAQTAATADVAAVETQPAAVATDDDGPSTGLVVAALVLGALGLLAGLAALMAARRRSA
ncbi:MAG TPA: YcnI family protein [Capillimicrobium sp.]|jgi:uncharacterized protein YcnI